MTSYDTTFCEGKKCKRREQCYRHRQLLRYRADPDPNKKPYVSMTYPAPENCPLYWAET